MNTPNPRKKQKNKKKPKLSLSVPRKQSRPDGERIKHNLASVKSSLKQIRMEKDSAIEQNQLLMAQLMSVNDELDKSKLEIKQLRSVIAGGNNVDSSDDSDSDYVSSSEEESIDVSMSMAEFRKRLFLILVKLSVESNATISTMGDTLTDIVWVLFGDDDMDVYSNTTARRYVTYRLLALDLIITALEFVTVVTNDKGMVIAWDESSKRNKCYQTALACYKLMDKATTLCLGYMKMAGKDAERSLQAIYTIVDRMNEYIEWWAQEANLEVLKECYGEEHTLNFTSLYERFIAALGDRVKTNKKIFEIMKQRFIRLVIMLQCLQHDQNNALLQCYEYLDLVSSQELIDTSFTTQSWVSWAVQKFKPTSDHPSQRGNLWLSIVRNEMSETDFLYVVEYLKCLLYSKSSRDLAKAVNCEYLAALMPALSLLIEEQRAIQWRLGMRAMERQQREQDLEESSESDWFENLV